MPQCKQIKIGHFHESKRPILFISGGFSVGGLIGYFVGKFLQKEMVQKQLNTTIKEDDEANKRNDYEGIKLFYPVFGRKRRNSLQN